MSDAHVLNEFEDREYDCTIVTLRCCAGCRDFSPYLAITATVKWWQLTNRDYTRAHPRKLLAEAVNLLTSEWHTATLAPMDMHAQMACVRLPDSLQSDEDSSAEQAARRLQVCQCRYHVGIPRLFGWLSASLPLQGCCTSEARKPGLLCTLHEDNSCCCH